MFRHYYPDRFPSLWERFDEMVKAENLVSVREVSRELEGQGDSLSTWVGDHASFFHSPTNEEMQFVAEIFKVRHFQTLIRQQERLQGKPVADPFVIAKAKIIIDGCVVTTEKRKYNAAQITNVCDHFKIPNMNLEDFMQKENWTF